VVRGTCAMVPEINYYDDLTPILPISPSMPNNGGVNVVTKQ